MTDVQAVRAEEAIMSAVDSITKATPLEIQRDSPTLVVDEDQGVTNDIDRGKRALNKAIREAVLAGETRTEAVARLRRPLLTIAAQARKNADTPSLWDRATEALGVGLEGGARSVLAERSPADNDLLEIRSIIKHTVLHDLVERKIRIKKTDTVPMLIRRLATYIISREPDQIWWYEYRFAQWARLLETYLRAVLDEKPKSVWLRNTACTVCGTRQVQIEGEEGTQLVPALMAEFREGSFRAIVCGACQATTWRGDDLETLAADIAKQPRLLRSGRADGRAVVESA